MAPPIFTSQVLISGMKGLGAEIAKNLVLAGVKSVMLHDEGVVELWDLSGNFIFSEDDVGKNRADASVQKLEGLNNSVVISTLTTELSKEKLSDFQVVVFTDICLEKAFEYNDYCRSHQPPIIFIKSEVRGLFGSVFCDFSPEFPVFHDEDPHTGIVTQVRQPNVNFKPLREALRDPGDLFLRDFTKFDRQPLLHLAFQALDKFIIEFGRFPVAGSENDAQKFISWVIEINKTLSDGKLEAIDQNLLRHFAFGARAVLNPMAAMFGGIVGQEVVKACSGKCHPHFQFLYFDSIESLPTRPLHPSDLKPLNSRYDAQISVFGSKIQKNLEDAKVFIVGSGALGCEFLKNLAVMGASCGKQGKLIVTDGDVGKCNPSNQFLFRDQNIALGKSSVAASAACLINPSLNLNIEALQIRTTSWTEDTFHYTFWEDLDVVINAVDNVNDRLYIGRKCLYFQKPLLESGTLGTRCNTQIVIPHLTQNYDASRDAIEKQFSWDTVDSFPHNIDHCLAWARYEFEDLFEKTPAEVNTYLTDPSDYIFAMKNACLREKLRFDRQQEAEREENIFPMKTSVAQARDFLKRAIEFLDKEKCEVFQDCIEWARLRFEDYFANRVKQLTDDHPEDATGSDGESLIWAAPKHFPSPLQFSVDDPSHFNFVMAASVLRAETFGIPIPDWIKSHTEMADAVNSVIVPEFQPDMEGIFDDGAVAIRELIMKLNKCRIQLPPGFKLNPIQFEKDDDTNYHMDLIAGLANMRARNYGIPEVNTLKAKWRIIPEIATSSAMATGLVCLELYKVIDGEHKLEDYRNTFADLELPLLSIIKPAPPKVINYKNLSWTVWDRWIFRGSPTLREFLQWLKDKDLSIFEISHRSVPLYNKFDKKKNLELMDRKLVDLAKEVAKADLPLYQHHLDVKVNCENRDVDISSKLRFTDYPPVTICFSETKQGREEGATKRHCSIAGTRERNNDNISSDINETLPLLFTSQVTVSGTQGGKEGATKRRCSIAGTTERNNDNISSDINETLPLLFTSQVTVSGMQGLRAKIAVDSRKRKTMEADETEYSSTRKTMLADKMEQHMQVELSYPPFIIYPQQYPWLLVCEGDDQESQTFVDIITKRFYKNSIPEMRGKVICSSRNSWLVLKTVVSMEVSLFNIVSKDLVQLPQLSSCGTMDICLLLSSPNEGDCCVIFINSSSNTFYYWKPGERKFHEQRFHVENCTIVAATVLRGTIYFLALIAIEDREDRYALSLFTAVFADSSLRFEKFTNENLPLHDDNTFGEADFLFESTGGELLYLHRSRQGGFRLSRMDFLTRQWVEVRELGEEAVFIAAFCEWDRHLAICCLAEDKGIQQNSVYFFRFKGRYLSIFDLESCSVSMSELPYPKEFDPTLVTMYDWVMIPPQSWDCLRLLDYGSDDT